MHSVYCHGDLDGVEEERDAAGQCRSRLCYRHGCLEGLCEVHLGGGGLLLAAHVQARPRRAAAPAAWSGGSGPATTLEAIDGDGAYLYPDHGLALLGRFQRGHLRCAHAVRLPPDGLTVLAALLSESLTAWGLPRTACGCLCFGAFSTAAYNAGPAFHEEQIDAGCIAEHPQLPDPLEAARVFVGPSRLPGAGEGLFAQVALPPGAVVAFYSGVRLTHDCVDARDWEANSNTLAIDDSVVVDVRGMRCKPGAGWRRSEEAAVSHERRGWQVPAELASIDRYCASLGHKANHSFDKQNAQVRALRQTACWAGKVMTGRVCVCVCVCVCVGSTSPFGTHAWAPSNAFGPSRRSLPATRCMWPTGTKWGKFSMPMASRESRPRPPWMPRAGSWSSWRVTSAGWAIAAAERKTRRTAHWYSCWLHANQLLSLALLDADPEARAVRPPSNKGAFPLATILSSSTQCNPKKRA